MAEAAALSGMPVQDSQDALPLRRILAFFFMVVGMFMAILDIQVVSSSLSDIQAGLSAGSDEIAWV
jgi:DHA2 family multidrug resistance protein